MKNVNSRAKVLSAQEIQSKHTLADFFDSNNIDFIDK